MSDRGKSKDGASEDEATEGRGGDPESARSRLLNKLTQRLQNPRELGGDAMAVVAAVLESSDRAKTEAVRMLAREVRHYLEELKLKEDFKQLVTSHSLELKMSVSLKPLAEAAEGQAGTAGDEPEDAEPEGSP